MEPLAHAQQAIGNDTVELAPLSKPVTQEEALQHPEQQQEMRMHPSSGTESSTNGPPRSKLRLGVTLFALYLSIYVTALDLTIATSSIPNISSFFHNAAAYAWIGSAYHLACAAMTPIWGATAAALGHKNVLLSVVLAFAAGAAISGCAPSAGILLLGRSIQGGAASGISNLVYLCISDLFSVRDRAFYYGLTGVAWGSASAMAPFGGGGLTQFATWRWNWWFTLPGTGLAFILMAFSLDIEAPRVPFWDAMRSVNWCGILSLLTMTVTILLGLSLGGIFEPWDSVKVVSLLASGCIAAFVFSLYESKYARRPLLSPHILRHHSNKASLLVCFAHGFVRHSVTLRQVNSAALYFLPLYFQACQSRGPLISGLFLLPITMLVSFTGWVTSLFICHTGHYVPLIHLGMMLITLGYGLLTLLSETSTIYISIAFSTMIGLGMGITVHPPLIATQRFLEYMDLAEATALHGLVRHLSTGISLVAGGVIFQHAMQSQSDMLRVGLSEAQAENFGGNKALASVSMVQGSGLGPAQTLLVKRAYAQSLGKMWILYACVSGFGLVCGLLVKKRKLNLVCLQPNTTTTKMDGEDER